MTAGRERMRERRKSFLPFGSPLIEQPEIDEVVDTLRSGWIGTGPKVKRLEALMCEYTGAKYARATNSCTAAMHLSLLAAGVKTGDEVITSPMTFCATANVILHCRATPVFVDIEKDTMNLDPTLVEKAVTPKTKAVMPVHMAGRPCNMQAILDIAVRHNLVVIEDAAHAIGAEYQGKKIGNIGHFTCFSFYVTKNVVTGEGGMVTTNDEESAEMIEMMSLHGLSATAWSRYSQKAFAHYEVIAPGYNYDMTDIEASLGIHQLGRVEKYLKRREQIWGRYDEAFADLPVTLPAPVGSNERHARHLYTLQLDIDRLTMSRNEVLQALHAENIGTGIHFLSLHLQKYYRERFGYKESDFPNAKYVSDRTFSIPFSTKLSDDDVEDVLAAVRKVLIAGQKVHP